MGVGGTGVVEDDVNNGRFGVPVEDCGAIVEELLPAVTVIVKMDGTLLEIVDVAEEKINLSGRLDDTVWELIILVLGPK